MADSRLHRDAPDHAGRPQLPRTKQGANASDDAQAGYLLELQRQAGNRAVATLPYLQTAGANTGNAAADAIVADMAAEKERIAKGRQQAIIDIHDNLEQSESGPVLKNVRAAAAWRDDMKAAYHTAYKEELTHHVVRRLSPSEDLVRILAYLYSGDDTDPYAQMGLAVIPLGTADDLILKLLEERKELSARQRLADDYRKAFKGVNKSGDTLLQHLFDERIAVWRYQKCQALLDHDLSKAEHLHFVLTSSGGTKSGHAIEIIEEVWDQGVPAFRQFLADWDHWVRGHGWVDVSLREAAIANLSFDERQRAEAVFIGWDQAQGRGQTGPDQTALSAAAQVAMFRALKNGDPAAVVRAAARLRTNREKEIEKDPRQAEAWDALRPNTEAAIRKVLASSWGGLTGDDDAVVEAIINLRRKPTPVDKAYFAMRRHDDKGVLAAVTEAWLAKQEGTMEQEALHPAAGDARPSFSVLENGVTSASDYWPKIQALLHPKTSNYQRGAERLAADLKGGTTTTKSWDLGEAYDFLKLIKSHDGGRERMDAVIEHFAGSVDAFAEALNSFEVSVLRKDILTLVYPDKTAKQRLESAQEREAASHTGLLDPVTMGLVKVYDVITSERTEDALSDSMRRLARLVRLTDAASPEVQAIMQMEGAKDLDALGDLTYDQFKSRLDEVRSIKKSATEAVGMVVDFAGRSALVFLLGPVGLPGLMAALGAYGSGMLVREGMLGADYDLFSRANAATLAGEIAMFGFDESPIEGVIQGLISKDTVAKWGGVVAAAGRDAKIAKGVQDGIKQAASKTAEKLVQDMIEGSDTPSIGDLMKRALHASAMGLVKGSTGHIAKSVYVQDDLAKRFVVNLQSIMLNGPPPKAALAMALTKEFTDMWSSPDWVNMSLQDVALRISKAAAISLASALPVAAALTPHQQRDANRAAAFLGDPALLAGLGRQDEKLLAAYRGATGHTSDAHLADFIKKGIKDPTKKVTWKDQHGVEQTFDVGRWVDDQAKVIDAAVTPRSGKVSTQPPPAIEPSRRDMQKAAIAKLRDDHLVATAYAQYVSRHSAVPGSKPKEFSAWIEYQLYHNEGKVFYVAEGGGFVDVNIGTRIPRGD